MNATVRIRLLWFPQAQFAGPIVAAERGLARHAGVEIVLQPVDFADPPVAALLARRAEFAIASPAHALESADPEAIAFLAAVQQRTPLVYGARRASGIATARDLAGRRVAVWPGGEDLELRWLLARVCGSPDAAVRIPANDTVAALVSGDADVAQMTTYHELQEAEAALGHDGLALVRADEAGAGLLKDGLLVRRDFMAGHGAIVDAVVSAVLEGWTIAFDHPDAAVDACARARPDMSREEHARQLADIRALSIAGATVERGLGYPDPVHAERAAAAMIETGHAPPRGTADLVDAGPWSRAPAAFRRTAWAAPEPAS